MRVNDLQDGQIVYARWGRYREDMIHPAWGPWRDARLYVQRNPRGEVVCITLKDYAWAEYAPMFPKKRGGPVRWHVGDDGEHDEGTLECEGYYLQIEGLTE